MCICDVKMSEEKYAKYGLSIFDHKASVFAKLRNLIKLNKITEKEAIEIYQSWKKRRKQVFTEQ